ncbi:NADP-dependent oxidoreductase [Streptomyces sp. NPDC091292]|uniref:NADP-dependent oxidoreductase n=1 Tax=Streptomyces sp. NPDC091292 TaxID=3365991 RepID=UPI0037F8D63D
MRAVVVSEFGGPDAVRVVETPVPEPGPGQIRIKVGASALNPVDAGVRAGGFGGAGETVGLGWDVAGVVDAVSAGTGWAVGDRVVALSYGTVRPLGAHAEYVVVDASAVAGAPTSVDTVHAATVPLNALTAAQALDLLDLKPGQSLLVTGAAGAVGGYAVQLASRQGVTVTGLAGTADATLVRGFGAAHFVSRDAARADTSALPVEPGSVDAVLDAAFIGDAALAAVRDGGVHVGVIPGQAPAPVRGVRSTAVAVAADGARLAELVALVDEGALTPRVAGTYALDDAAKAHARLAEGGLRGKLVLIP